MISIRKTIKYLLYSPTFESVTGEFNKRDDIIFHQYLSGFH